MRMVSWGSAPSQSAERVTALSDGVFAIAMTLLIIDVVAVGKNVAEGERLSHHLLREWPTLAAFLVGFLTLLVCWANHQCVFESVGRVDSVLVWVNGLKLAIISAVPLPTALLAANFTGPDRRTAFFIYGVTYFLLASSFWLMTRVIEARGLLAPGANAVDFRRINHIYGVAMVWTTAALGVVLVNVWAACLMWGIMFAVFGFPNEFAALLHQRSIRKTALGTR
ncbi:MAG: TMEM175 family protein [Thermomicrobiales bacterium]